ncbi:MAG: fumarylacetoacetate hydrolase family protein [Pseudomonadota bacterium]|nr:fumarylacetoacetate hydrolase family protein [Pseudomonadota bacterium]
MSQFTVEMRDAAASYLVAARKAKRPIERLPEACRPVDLTDALAIQERVRELLGATVGGWKCSVPSAEKAIVAAPIFAASIVRESPCPILPVAGKARIEPEIAFVIGRDLPRRATPYSDVEVRAAIAETRAVLELIGPRYADPAAVSYPEFLADNIANQGLFVGPAVANGLDLPLEGFRVAVDQPDGALLTRDGKHPDGHPLRPLFWLANHLASRGTGLVAGQIVTTGSYCGVLDVPFDTPLTVALGDLAQLSVRFTAK